LEFNPEQLEAVKTLFGPVLILAGAGTGKTRVITERAVELIKTATARPENILCITFTNKAANEMKQRIAQRISKDDARKMLIATFHSFCARILRLAPEKFERTKRFDIISTSEQISLVRTAIRELGLGKSFKPEIILSKISLAKNADTTPAIDDEYWQAAREILPLYEQSLKACNAFDFDDLLLKALALLRDDRQLLKRLQRQYRFIQVDEYQDTNDVQFEILRLLAGEEKNICVVGDDDQSIYGWRGAKIQNILDFEKAFGPNVKVINLFRNYRSSTEIIEAATNIIRFNTKRKPKWLRSEIGSKNRIRILACEDETQEVSVIARMLENYKAKGGKFRHCAILFRTAKYFPLFEQEFKQRGIPYLLVGGQRFYERKEIKDFLAYLTLIDNTNNNLAFTRIVNYPPRGIGRKLLDKIADAAKTRGQPLYKAARSLLKNANLTKPARNSLASFISIIEAAKNELERKPIREVLEELLQSLRFKQVLEKEATNPVDADDRFNRILQLIASIENYIANPAVPFEQRDLKGFLERIALFDDQDKLVREDAQQTDAVMLITIHSAKGLEFPNVVIPAFEEGHIPHKKALEENYAGEDEERRLCYVAMTRAMRSLSLTFALKRTERGREIEPKPSRFLAEIPENLCVKGFEKIDRKVRKQQLIEKIRNAIDKSDK